MTGEIGKTNSEHSLEEAACPSAEPALTRTERAELSDSLTVPEQPSRRAPRVQGALQSRATGWN